MIDVKEVSQERLMAVTEDLAQWTRLSGSAEERAAAEYLAAELTAIGFTTRLIKHDAYISLPGKATLRVTSPRKRDVSCITHSMGLDTDGKGVDGDLVYVAKGRPEDFVRHKAAGKFALVDGRATPQLARDATRAGVRGLVCISGRIPHEMCCSPVWGNPSDTTAGELPNIILISVAHAEGEWMPELCRHGGVQIHVATHVDTRWRQTPIVQADLEPTAPNAESSFVMLKIGRAHV